MILTYSKLPLYNSNHIYVY